MYCAPTRNKLRGAGTVAAGTVAAGTVAREKRHDEGVLTGAKREFKIGVYG